MLCRAVGAAALVEAAAVAPAIAQTLTPAPLVAGDVSFAMHSTIIGAFTGHAPIARAEFTGNRLSDVRGMAEVRTSDLRTGIALRDRHMLEVMAADSFPTIRFDLVDLQVGVTVGDTARVTFEGRLTLDGVTRPVRAPGTVVTRPGVVEVKAAFTIDMRDYGIVPPVRALVLRVAPDVVVTARLSFGGRTDP